MLTPEFPIEPTPDIALTRRLLAGIVAGWRDAREQLRGANLNPHEGKLRASVQWRTDDMNIPDFPPVHDDSL